MKLVFMGTSEFSAVILEGLLKEKYNVACVYSQPPSNSGRGMNKSLSPVHKLSSDYSLNIRVPKSLKSEEVQKEFSDLKPDVVIVASYGLILPKFFVDNFTCINVHASLLPKWRGAAPVERCLESGDKVTGITIIRMDEGLDTGKILLKEEINISPDMNNGHLYDLLAKTGLDLTIKTLEKIPNNNLKYEDQDNSLATYANKITKKEKYLDCFSLTVSEADCKIRAFNPFPSVYIILNKERIKILKADYILKSHNYITGSIIDKNFNIALKDGILMPVILQRPGKRAMKLSDMLNGYKFTVGSLLEKED